MTQVAQTTETIKPSKVELAGKSEGLSAQTANYLATALGVMCVACGAGQMISAPSMVNAASNLAASITGSANVLATTGQGR